jgi:hypothetical protein
VTLAWEARIQLMSAALMWLLAAAALVAIVIVHGLVLTSPPVSSDRYAIVFGYDLALLVALGFFFKSGRSTGAKILLALILLPAAVIGAVTVREQLAAEASTRFIR